VQLIEFADAGPGARCVAIGTFDGVHLGHRAVIEGADAVLTFEPHPVAVVAPAHAPRLLTPLAIKADRIAALGVEQLIVMRFDAAFAAESPEQFIDAVLVRALAVQRVSIGENFRFGHAARGDAALLTSDTRFSTRVAPLRELDGEVVSSSHIRSLVAAGDIARAATMLGAPFELRGNVVSGDRRGRELGFPTANLVPDPAVICPGHGVYAAIANDKFAAAVNVGVRPTFETGRGTLIEAHLLDFAGDLYGSELRLQFLERLRGERRFASVPELVAAMHDDVEAVRAICASASVRPRK
jgi:riboflavin kinase/FMN adenylyltransferase